MSVAGKWNVSMDTPIGTMSFVWEFENADGVWVGKMIGQGPVSDSDLRAIQVTDDSMSFETTTKSPLGALELRFQAAVADNAMMGTCKTKFGDQTFSAVKA